MFGWRTHSLSAVLCCGVLLCGGGGWCGLGECRFTFDKAVTGVAFSPKGDFLATTHVNNLGIFLW